MCASSREFVQVSAFCYLLSYFKSIQEKAVACFDASGTRWRSLGSGSASVVVVLAAPVSVVWNVRLQQPLSQLQFWVSSPDVSCLSDVIWFMIVVNPVQAVVLMLCAYKFADVLCLFFISVVV